MKEQKAHGWDIENAALWDVRRKIGIKDDEKNGWKLMSMMLVRQFLPEALTPSPRDQMIMVLMGSPDDKRKRGPKTSIWTSDVRRNLLELIDKLKFDSDNQSETDKSIIERHFQDGFEDIQVTTKTLINEASKSRSMAKNGML